MRKYDIDMRGKPIKIAINPYTGDDFLYAEGYNGVWCCDFGVENETDHAIGVGKDFMGRVCVIVTLDLIEFIDWETRDEHLEKT